MKIVLIIGILFFVGCTTTQPHITEYVLAPEITSKHYEAKQCLEKSLKVGQPFGANVLLTKKMSYIENGVESATFTESQWSRRPSRVIGDVLLQSIRSSGLFEDVSSFRSRAKTELLLETHLEHFVQHFSDTDERSYVELVMRLNLLETKYSKSIAHTVVKIKMPSSTLDARGGVIALNRALSEALTEVNNWLNEVCQ